MIGTAVDTAYSFVEDKPNGIYSSIDRLKVDNHKAGAIFDFAAGILFDGLAGGSSVIKNKAYSTSIVKPIIKSYNFKLITFLLYYS